MTTLTFIEQLSRELGRVSGDIKVSLTELGELFGKSEGFISGVINSLENPSDTKYLPDYKFSKEILENLKETAKLDEYSLRDFLKLIEEFEKVNPEIPEYSKQQHTINNVDAFSGKIEIDAAYWHGFLWADGHVLLRGDYIISFSQSQKDKKSVENFADFVGFDAIRIDYNPRFRKLADGTIKRYEVAEIIFRSKIIINRLQELDFSKTKDGRNQIPDFVKEAIYLAKSEAIGKNIHWSQTRNGKIAHAWLLGFYDGDGSYHGGYSAQIFAASEQLLLEIKNLFESPNIVREIIELGEERLVFGKLTVLKGYYYLSLGLEIFRRILASYTESMTSKRP